MRVFYPPEKFPPNAFGVLPGQPIVFLAGSIEQGLAERWQDQVVEGVKDLRGTILNPRRPDWDSTWPNDSTCPAFRGQVEWELEGLTRAQLVVMYLQPGTQSPISLLELGLLASRTELPDLVVCCPPGYWRRGNVQIVCERYGIRQVSTLTDIVQEVRNLCGRCLADLQQPDAVG
jgi:hypothetical protein